MITVYGADWCEDTRRSQRLLRRLHIPYHYINIDEDLEGLERATALANGARRTPTIDLGISGAPLVEPDNDILTAALVERQMLSPDDADERLHLQNVGDLERVVRTSGGLALMVLAGAAPRGLRTLARLTGFAAASTGITGWCPIFYAAGVSSLGGPGDRPTEAERRSWITSRHRSPASATPSPAAAEEMSS